MTTAATLGFVAKGVHTTLGSQVRVGARLEVVIVMVTWLAWTIVAWAAVVKLARGTLATLALRSVATACVAIGVAWWAIS